MYCIIDTSPYVGVGSAQINAVCDDDMPPGGVITQTLRIFILMKPSLPSSFPPTVVLEVVSIYRICARWLDFSSHGDSRVGKMI
jgi:hypothetical protein